MTIQEAILELTDINDNTKELVTSKIPSILDWKLLVLDNANKIAVILESISE